MMPRMTDSPRLQPPRGARRAQPPRRVARKDRLVALIALLRDGGLHRGEDLARALGITPRSLYRDMDLLKRAGVPVAGQRGRGYRMTAPVTLPALNLDMEELEALHLGLAVMSQAEDPPLRAAARRLAARIDAALPEEAPEAAPANSAGWGLAVHPFADPAAGIRHMPALRAALRNRRPVRLAYRGEDGTRHDCLARLLKLEFWGRIWTCTFRCRDRQAARTIRVDRIEALGDPAPAHPADGESPPDARPVPLPPDRAAARHRHRNDAAD